MDYPPLLQEKIAASTPALSPRKSLSTPTVSPRITAAADQEIPSCYEAKTAESPRSQPQSTTTPRSSLLSPFRLFGGSGCSEDISGFRLFAASNSQETLDGGGGQLSSQSGDSPQSPIIKAASKMYDSLQRGAVKIGQQVLKPYAVSKFDDDDDDNEEKKEDEFSLLYNASSPQQREPRRIFGVDDEFHRNKLNFETKRMRRL